MGESINFNPNIKCPHCGAHNTPSVSGFGRTGLNVREHNCRSCGKDYKVLIVVEATTEDIPTDISLASIQHSVQRMKQRIQSRKASLVSNIEGFADELVRTEASTCGRQN